MNTLLLSEARKLAATRSWLALAAAPILYPLLTVTVLLLTSPEAAGNPGAAAFVRSGVDVAALSLLIVGILAVAGEYRHGTIVPSLLASPRRTRFLAAKLVSQASLAAAVSLTGAVVALVAGGLYFAGQDVEIALLSTDTLLITVGVVVVAAFYATAGAALGAIVRNQTAAITAALVWMLAVEEIVPIVLRQPKLREWLPGGATDRLLHLADPPAAASSAWIAALMVLVITAALVAGAVATTKRADIS